MRNYTQNYQYDAVGNIQQMRHQASGNAWVRNYQYQGNNNRLISTQLGTQTYLYPHHAAHGFMTAMPHLEEIDWNFKEELVRTVRQRRLDGGTRKPLIINTMEMVSVFAKLLKIAQFQL